ncbi:MAG TPA: aminotransferase class V-fold PLP-dependent enzyme [Candidatus Nanopelagicaceae bacterium]
MAHITANFLAESPLSPRAREALGAAIDQGWADPRKLAHASARARILHEGAIASLAENLGLRTDEIEILGEPSLGHFYAVEGLLQPADTLVYSNVDRKEVIALSRGRKKAVELPVDSAGLIQTQMLRDLPETEGVFALQIANGETGVIQNVEALLADSANLRIATDFSTAGTRVPLPSRWDSAFFDSRAWQGPQGIGILAIRNGSQWRNPLPHIASTRTPQSSSLPLVIAAAVALEEWNKNEEFEKERLRGLSDELRRRVSTSIENCDVAGDLDQSLPHITSFSFLYVEGEELLRRLEMAGFAVDSGSACTAEDLQPSHVLAAMGVLTHGNIRITLHSDTTPSQVIELAEAIKIAVTQLRTP